MSIASPIDTPPLKRKSALKKHSISSSAENSPLRPSNRAANIMNDDAAEKASRRKSAHFGDLAIKASEYEGKKEAGQKRQVSALAVQAAQQGQSGTGVKKAKRLSAVAPAAAPVVSMEVMNTNFEEWMKLATDNVRVHLATTVEVTSDGAENHGEQHMEFCSH